MNGDKRTNNALEEFAAVLHAARATLDIAANDADPAAAARAMDAMRAALAELEKVAPS